MKTLTLEELRKVIDDRFGGVLEAGVHEKNGKACVLESFSAAQGMDWTDNPKTLRTWDLRPLNDIPVSPAVRAKHIVPVLVAYQGSMNWPVSKQKRVSANIAILTMQKIISKLPVLSVDLSRRCRQAFTLKKARAAASAVHTATLTASAASTAPTAAIAAAREAVRAAVWTAEAVRAAEDAAAEAAAREAAGAAAREASMAVAMAVAAAAAAAARDAGGGEAALAIEKVFILACKVYLSAKV